MDQTQKLLQSIVENARTGLDACEQLLELTKDENMRAELMTQQEQYQSFARDAEKALYAAGAQPHTKSPMGRAGMWVGLRMNTLLDNSASHIADIAIQGATMGVTGMTKDCNDLTDADANARGIASAFIAAQQGSIDRMKAFL